MNTATDEILTRLILLAAMAVTVFATGLGALVAQVNEAFGAQINDQVVSIGASLSVLIGTAFFGWMFKLLLEVKDSQTRTDQRVLDLERRIKDMED